MDDIILEQLASSHATLSEDEKNLGVCLVDIGGGTTDIAVFTDGAISHTAVIPIAGDQVTNDIASALRTPSQSADLIKIEHGCALTQLADLDEDEQEDSGKKYIDVPSVGARPHRQLTRQTLAEVVQPRYEELFSLVQLEIKNSGYEDRIPRGVVLTGGSANMKGAVELAEEIFHTSVRVGAPQLSGGLADTVKNPIYSTGVGLLLFAVRELQEPANLSDASMQGVWGRMKSWFQGNF